MGRLIDTSDLNNQIMSHKSEFGVLSVAISNIFEDMVRDTPTVRSDMRLGEWDKDGACLYCGYIRQWNDDAYCGHCGAKLGAVEEQQGENKDLKDANTDSH